ncbi:hypothetical protein ACFQVA_04040 [Actinomadura keratinilytica]
MRPRTWFGERWISSARELFAENLRYFPGLLPICSDEDPEDALAAGQAPPSPSWSCTTAPSTAGTARSTASPTACPTSASRTASCPPGPP